MSKNQAAEFLEAFEKDEDLARRADRVFIGTLLTVAGEAGYDLTEAELREAIDEKTAGDGVSDGELEQVAGGIRSFASTANSAGLTGASKFNTAGFDSFSKTGYSGGG